jgi:hypothetical protein
MPNAGQAIPAAEPPALLGGCALAGSGVAAVEAIV